MALSKKKVSDFYPDWYHEEAPADSWRSILKWGDPKEFKAPSRSLYRMMKDVFDMTDSDFQEKKEMGLEPVKYDHPSRFTDEQLNDLRAIVGRANVTVDDYARLSVAYGKTMIDLMRLRKHIVENVPDAVVYPRNRADIIGLVKYCTEHKIPMYVYGGGSSVTRGAGQNSSYYGKIEDIVISQEYVTPVGIIKSDECPRNATGPSIDQIMMGSEGTFGILTHVTLRVFKYMPENRFRFSYVFHNWDDAVTAAREIMQGEFGFPSVFRVSDAEETEIAFHLYGVADTPIDALLKARGYESNKRCLMLGFTEGERHFSKNVKRRIWDICHKYGAMYTTGIVTRGWEKGRFRDPYLREDLGDYGLMLDTLECSVNWDNFMDVYKSVRAYCKSRPNTMCMTHMSHFYPQGANLYFIFQAKMDSIEEYLEYQYGIMDHIQAAGASMSHHHGIGKMTAPWLEAQIGHNEMEVYRALKEHFDPDHIMNPGGTLGLDLPEDQRRDLIHKKQ